MKIKAGSFTLKIMQYRTLGKTGLRVSAIGFGGWAIGGNAFGESLGATDDAVSMAALNRAWELGCNTFNTADLYGRGHSEQLIGKALKGWTREEWVIITKGGHDFTAEALEKSGGVKKNFSESHLRRAVEDSLQRLGLESIDVYLLHNPPLELIQHGKVFEVLRDLKQSGKIRFFGVSIHDPQEGIQAIRVGQVDVVEAVWNLFDPRIEKLLLETCDQTQTGLIIREPLARGFLSGKMPETIAFEKGDVRAVWPKPLVAKRIQAAERFRPLVPEGYNSLARFAMAYSLANPAVATVTPDCVTPDDVIEAMATADLPPLTEKNMEEIRGLQGVL
ncbi:MAG TPA: aldo/keto reductase [Coleofasciculaceae cyanobacterium]